MVLDVGDAFLGSPYFTIFEGEVEMRCLHELGYAAMAIGNHDFDGVSADGSSGLPHLFRQASAHAPTVTLLCANLRHESDGSLVALGGRVITAPIRGGAVVRVGVVGVLGSQAFDAISTSFREGYTLDPPLEAARREAAALMASSEGGSNGVDVMVCLSHSGVERGGDRALAASGIFDVVFSGHE